MLCQFVCIKPISHFKADVIKTYLFSVLFFLAFSFSGTVIAQHNFVAGKEQSFLLDGKPFVVRAAELHYPRIPKEYWDHRIKQCKAMGMNTICIYLFWNLHEQQEGKYNFSGENDFVAFIKLVQQNGMYCIVRPGPYICAEWDMGGLPWWLLKKKDLEVRSRYDSLFMSSVRRYMGKVGPMLAPLQIQNGGNIIMVQVENEYGVWGNDQAYMTAVRDMIRNAGLDKVQLFRCDWSSNFDRYELDDVASTLNFGAGANIEDQFKKFREKNPGAPLMCSEYWTGWFDQWGRQHETRGVNTFIGSLKDMLDRNISFSLYMAHGGTSFGQWSGANAPPYAPTISSYDYDAPIDESGHLTPKFFAIRELLSKYLGEGETLGEIPAEQAPLIQLAPIHFTQQAALFANLPQPVQVKDIQPMEMFNQGWGRILYRTTLTPATKERQLVITGVHDWAKVFVNGKPLAQIDRRKSETGEVTIPATSTNARLDILIETTGRVNYGKAILDRKGISGIVQLVNGKDTVTQQNWLVYNLPVDGPFQDKPRYTPIAKTTSLAAAEPAWYKASFQVNQPGDTYLDLSHWTKGMVWINGRSLGRFWNIGPTQTMFLPGTWLKKGSNEIIVTDVQRPDSLVVNSTVNHIYMLGGEQEKPVATKQKQLKLAAEKPVAKGAFSAGSGWKEVMLPATTNARYFCLEALSPQQQGDKQASIAELEIIGEDGSAISSVNWKLVYASSEEAKTNSTADKVFDLQETLIWQTAAKLNYPHSIVIDMGTNIKVKGFRVLPRVDNKKEGMIKDYRFYLKSSPFIISAFQ
ncbi:glycoside hydrolase family 35 protein [Filimonas effusa]|uniref:Beta-galactosidase n=1 Tax=Filimonas effusa TaxID=2508721 RepID=A0A4Q1DBZ2_9BACT|nr:beta-galactosidase family protein [Filimonas effusa]RXK86850.1 beta-galactosidase [Filimonas effusa]